MPNSFVNAVGAFPGFVLSQFYNWTSYYQTGQLDAARQAFMAWLRPQPTIRLFVENAPGSGHQTSTIRILRRLVAATAASPVPGYGYAGTIEVVYRGQNQTLAKLERLLPELGGHAEGQIGGATVRLITWEARDPLAPIQIGFTGGADEDEHYAAELKTAYFLRLQPYGFYHSPEQVQFQSSRWPYVDLASQALIGPDFNTRAYALESPDIDWLDYANDGNAKIVEWLTDPQRRGFDLVPVYGIRTGRCELARPAGGAIIQLIAGLLDSLRDGAGQAQGAKPIVIINADSYSPDPHADYGWPAIEAILAGGPTADEARLVANGQQASEGYRAYLRRKAYFLAKDLGQRSTLLYDHVDIAAVTQAVAALGPDQILWVQLAGGLTQPIFDHLFAHATLPSVFEGNNTANMALMTGRPFFNVSRPSEDTINRYPTRTLGRRANDPSAIDTQTAANTLRDSLHAWPTAEADAAPVKLGAFIRNLRADIATNGPIQRYFTDIRDFYRVPANDKLNVAVAFLNYLINGRARPVDAPMALRMLASPAVADAGVLDQLWTSIQVNTRDKQLDLFPGAITAGRIFEFFTKLLESFGAKLSLTVANCERTPASGAIQAIELSGISASFAPTQPVTVDIEFTAPEDVLVATFTFTGELGWSLPGLPWIVFEQPFVRLAIADADVGLSGAVGGMLSGFEFSIPVPISGVWGLRGSFADDPPSIDRFLQILGGNNPSAMLPAPLNVAGNLGLREFELAWDDQAKRLLGIGLTLATGKSLPLFGGVSLADLSVEIELPDPADPSSMTAALLGSFAIGGGAAPPTIAVSVDLPAISALGRLEHGPLGIGELFSAFLPGLPVPAALALAQIDDAGFVWVAASRQLGFSLALSGRWTLDLPLVPAVELTALSVEISREGLVNRGQIAGQLAVLPDAPTPVVLGVAAGYADGGWSFSAFQTGDGVSVGQMLQYYFGWRPDPDHDWTISALGFSATQDDGAWSWEFSGELRDWSIPFLGLTLDGAFALGVGNSDAGAPQRHGSVSVELAWQNITLRAFAKLGDSKYSYGFGLGPLSGTVDQNPQNQWIGALSLKDQTLGGIIETFVAWVRGQRFGLPAPWNILDDIPLGALELRFNFTTKQVSFALDVGPIRMGFATIEKVSMSYAGGKALITLEGSFLWQDKPGEPLSWDAADPTAAPTPPGQGSKYLDLRLLALGQRVSIKGSEGFDSVQKAITAMRTLPKAKGGAVPVPTDPQPGQPYYDPAASWLIGADMGVLRGSDGKYFVTLQLIFDDPRFYALRVALDGPAAKVFAGLDFQILYRQVSEGVGVYQAELTLPAAMRTLTVGAYTITMPVFAIAIYTNGDFFVDIGFPWNQDFSRSFTVEALIPPGIPVIGSAGFYFGKLSGQTATTLPVHDPKKGQFNPVVRFGFGAQVGFGKSIQLGVLSAGFSLTVFGILEGTIARWNPFALGEAQTDKLDTSYYFKLAGTFGIIGRLWGTIDFAIIKAKVDITIKVFAQITFESNMPIPISVVVSVDVRVSIKINLGLFSIRIHFSFSARIKQTFVLGSASEAPWSVDASPMLESGAMLEASPALGRLAEPVVSRLRAFTSVGVGAPKWSNLQAPHAPAALKAYFASALTVVGDGAATSAEQLTAYVACLFLESVAGADADAGQSARKAAGTVPDTSFEQLAKQLLRWAVAAIKPTSMSAAEVDAAMISDDELQQLLDVLGEAGDDSPVPVAAIEAFLAAQVRIHVEVETAAAEADGTLFPLAPTLILDIAKHGDRPPLRYRLSDYNSLAGGYVASLREYFAQLELSFADDSPTGSVAADLPVSRSLVEFVFADYFVLLLRQLVSAARESLRDFKWPIDEHASSTEIVAQVNALGQLGGAFTGVDLFIANGDHALAVAKPLRIAGVRRSVSVGESFTSIAADPRYAAGFDAAALATANAALAGLLRTGAMITVKDRKDPFAVPAGASLEIVAAQIGLSLAALLADSDVLAREDLLVSLTVLDVPEFGYATVAGDTLLKVAGAFGRELADLASEANLGVVGLFSPASDGELDLVHLPQFQVAAIIAEIQRSLGLQHLSGMASRFYLHGLRLPTAGITPKVRGLLVSGSDGALKLPADAGLFALTGQAFEIPSALGDEAFSFSLVCDDQGPSWIVLPTVEGSNQPPTLTVSIAPGSEDAARIAALHAYVSSTSPDLSTQTLGPEPAAALRPASFPLTAARPWASAGPVPIPGGGSVDGGDMRLWSLPPALRDLPPAGGLAEGPLPSVEVQLARYDEASGAMQTGAPGPWSWATTVDFAIKRVNASADSPTSADSYEIVGVTTEDTVTLERLLAIVRSDDQAFAGVWLAFAPAGSSTTNTGLQSDAGAAVTMSIAQTNLTTETRPPASPARMFMAAARLAEPPELFNRPSTFVRLLWEASITRSGGFFLYYRDRDEARGLPDHLFSANGQANATLVILWARQASGDLDVVQPYYNALLTGRSFATRDTVLQLVAAPQVGAHGYAATDTLASIAARSFSDLQQLGERNAALSLSKGVGVHVPDGLHQVPPAVGQTLAQIVSRYAGSDAARKQQLEVEIPERNPGLDFGKALPEFTAVRLPALEVVVGTHPGGDTLASIADFYGTSVGMLATANADRPGLYSLGVSVQTPGGPMVRIGTAALGTAAWVAERTVPAAVPDSAGDPDWARLYIEHDFTLLGLSIAPNQDFVASNLGLPAGPSEAGDDSGDKIQVPVGKQAGELWSFSRALAYTAALRQTAGADDNPYLANDRVLQIEFEWLDYYGNRLHTPLSDPAAGAAKPWNQPPIVTGYTDKLLGVGQWPSTSLHWQIAGGPQLRVEIDFSTAAYLDDAGQDAAQRDLAIYQRAYLQLSDPNGIELALHLSVLRSESVVLADQVRVELVAWVASVHAWLLARSTGQTPAAPQGFAITSDFTLAELDDALIQPLTMQLSITRLGVPARDLANVPAVARSQSSVPPLGADDHDGAGLRMFATGFEQVLQTDAWLLKVAVGSDRAAAASQAGGRIWAVRVGKQADQALAVRVANPGKPMIFAPRPLSNQLQRKAGVPIYAYVSGQPMNFAGPSQRVDFADIDADAWARRFFDDLDGLLSPRFVAAMQIVGEHVGRDFLAELLGYKRAIAAQVKTWMIPVFSDAQADPGRAAELFEQRLLEQLGNAYRVRAAVEFAAQLAGPPATGSAAPVLFGELLCGDAQGDRAASDVAGALAPALDISLTSPKLELDATSSGQTRPLTFLVSAPDRRADDSAGVVPKVSLDLRFAGSAIEHEIAAVPGIEGYKASSWLQFVVALDAGADQLACDLGRFDVPLILRAYPEIPDMSGQTGTATVVDHDGAELFDLTRWTYGFAYGASFHYPQDEVHARVRFNVQGAAAAGDGPEATTTDLFEALAEWISVFPAIEADLAIKLAPVDPDSDADTLDAAANVLTATLAVLGYMFDPKLGRAMSMALRGVAPEPEPYVFTIREGSRSITQAGAHVDALIVSILGEPPKDSRGQSVISEPAITIPSYHGVRQPDLPGYTYLFKDAKTGAILDAETGQAIRERGVVLPGIDILGRQDAWASIYLVRNRDLVEDRTTAEPFVYTTSPVQFASALRPTLERTAEIDIARIPGAGQPGEGPFERPLVDHLAALFSTLLRDNLEPDLTMQLTVQYGAPINPALPAPRLPILMLPPTSVRVLDGGGAALSLAELEADVAAAIARWFSATRNLLGEGKLDFDLSVFSSLTAQAQPLLRLRTLTLAVRDIVPALPPGA